MSSSTASTSPAGQDALALAVLERVATGASLECALEPLLDALQRRGKPFLGAFLLRDLTAGGKVRSVACEVLGLGHDLGHTRFGGAPRGGQTESHRDAAAGRDAATSGTAVQEALRALRLDGVEHGQVIDLHSADFRPEMTPNSGWRPLRRFLLGRGLDYGFFESVLGPQGTWLGALACFWTGDGCVTDDEQALIGHVARLAGLAAGRARRDETLSEGRHLVEALGSSMPGVIFQFMRRPDGTTSVPYASRSAKTLYGVDPADFKESAGGLQEVIHPEDWDRFEASIERSARTLDTWSWEGRIRPRNRKAERWVRIASQPTRRADGSVLWNGLLMDVTEQKEVARRLRKSEARYHALFESAGDAIFIMRGETFVDCNAKTLDLFGCAEKSDLIGRTPWAFSPEVQPDGQPSKQKAEAILGRVLRGEKQHFDWRHTRQDGTAFDAEVTLGRLRLEDEVLIQAIVRDVTERRAAQRALQASEERWQRMAERHPDGLVITVGEEVRYVNPSSAEIYGVGDPDELVGRPVYDLYESDLRDRMTARKKQLDEGRPTPPIEVEVICLDGTRKTLESRAVPIEYEGAPAALSVVRDVTARRGAEKALKASEKKYRRLVEQTADWVWQTDRQGRLTYVSPQIKSMTGYAPNEVLGRSIFNFLEGLPNEDVREVLLEGEEAPHPFSRFESTLVGKDGAAIYLETSGAPTYDEEGRYCGYHGVSRDVTERVERQERLERQAVRLGIVNEISSAVLKASTPEAIAESALTRLEGLVPFFSASVTEYDLAAERAHFLARTPGEAAPETLKRSLPFAEGPGIECAFQGDLYYVRDLREEDARTSAQEDLLAWGARSYVIVPCMVEGEIMGSLNVTRSEPRAFSSEDLSALTEVASLLALALQQARYRERLVQAKEESEAAREKAEEMNRLKSAFLANMSHEIRTPLTSVIGFSELLRDMDLPASAHEFTGLILRGGRRLLNTLDSVLNLSQLEAGAVELSAEEIALRPFAKDLVESFQPQAREAGVELDVTVPPAPIRASADRAALSRVMSNLISNGVKFTREGGRVTVRLAREEKTFMLEVEDTGVGIDPEFVPDLFDAFKQESTGDARQFEGSGLGLAITKKLVDLMGGTIEAESVKGEGATFTVRLPL